MSKEELVLILQKRFSNNPSRHTDVTWDQVLPLLTDNRLETLSYMMVVKSQQ